MMISQELIAAIRRFSMSSIGRSCPCGNGAAHLVSSYLYCVAARTRFLCFPIDLKITDAKAISLGMLPTAVNLDWTDQFHTILSLTLDQPLSLNISGIDQMFVG